MHVRVDIYSTSPDAILAEAARPMGECVAYSENCPPPQGADIRIRWGPQQEEWRKVPVLIHDGKSICELQVIVQ
jgi:hypothetical protein